MVYAAPAAAAGAMHEAMAADEYALADASHL